MTKFVYNNYEAANEFFLLKITTSFFFQFLPVLLVISRVKTDFLDFLANFLCFPCLENGLPNSLFSLCRDNPDINLYYLKRAFSAPKICTVEAGYFAKFVRLPACEINRAPTWKTHDVRANKDKIIKK